MKKMNLLISIFALGFLISGCSNKKDVVIDVDSKPSVVHKIKPTQTIKKVKNNELSYVNIVESNINGISVALKSVHFGFDKFNISSSMRVIANENYVNIAQIIKDNSEVKIKLEGNCDEWGTDEYNYALGLKRAKSIKDSLVNKGIDSNKIVLVSFGESNPVCTDKSNVCWKKNRRVDYRLLP